MNYIELRDMAKEYIAGFKKHFNGFLGLCILASCILTTITIIITKLNIFKMPYVMYVPWIKYVIYVFIVNQIIIAFVIWGCSILTEGIIDKQDKIPYRNVFKRRGKSNNVKKAFLINVIIVNLVIVIIIFLGSQIGIFLEEILGSAIIGGFFIVVWLIWTMTIPIILTPIIEEKNNSTMEIVQESWNILFKKLKLFSIISLNLAIGIILISFLMLITSFFIFMGMYAISTEGLKGLIFILPITLGVIGGIVGLIFIVVPNYFINSYLVYVTECI